MTKRDCIEWRQGAAAFKAGKSYDHTASHAWKMGFINAQVRQLTLRVADAAERVDAILRGGTD